MLLVTRPIPTVFNVDVNTESLEVIVPREFKAPVLHVKSVSYSDEFAEVYIPNFSGSVTVEPETIVNIQRIGNGPVVLTFTNEAKKVVTLESSPDSLGETSKNIFDNFFEIIIKDVNDMTASGITHVFQLSGEVILGEDVTDAAPNEPIPILLDGKITMTNKSYLSRKEFISSEHILSRGDKVFFDSDIGYASGFVVTSSNQGLLASIRVKAQEAIVKKVGPALDSNLISIAPTYFDRISNDLFFQALSLFLGTIIFITTLISFYYDSYTHFNDKNT